jgi:hypothetical protein
MIECILTLDYEIYGNGTGALKDLVYEPAERLRDIFRKWDALLVVFVEVAELEKIDACGTDASIDLVKEQIKTFYQDGFEVALHLHPQWCNARHESGVWTLDYSEYNLCTLSRARISQIVEKSLDYLREAVGRPDFTPLSFRAGNWLFQPTETAASVLAEKGLRIDSSVFKGGLQHSHSLDYRPALKNGYYWPFNHEVTELDSTGPWLEVPIYTEMVPLWKMPTPKRVGLNGGIGIGGQSLGKKFHRALDLMRFLYPLKLDFCRMTLKELKSMLDRIVREDELEPSVYRPVVAIGHTKDLTDSQTVDDFLSFLRAKRIAVSTFESAHSNLLRGAAQSSSLRRVLRPRAGALECASESEAVK